MSNETATTYKEGDAVYFESGAEAIYVTETSDGGHIVQTTMSDGETFDCYPGEYLHVDRVLKTPPIQKYHAEVKALREESDKIQSEINGRRSELRNIEREESDIKTRLKEHEALKHIDEFLKGEMTYFVFNRYGRISIEDQKTALKCDDYRDERKLVSLFGGTKGDLLWKCNRYKDGSGTWSHFIPCLSHEEAIKIAQSIIDEGYQAYRDYSKEDKDRRDHNLKSLTESAKKLGFAIPDDIASVLNQRAIKQAKKCVQDCADKYDKAHEDLVTIIEDVKLEGAKP